jgi:hypothetical protein
VVELGDREQASPFWEEGEGLRVAAEKRKDKPQIYFMQTALLRQSELSDF